MDIPSALLAFQGWAESFVGSFGYLGIFIVSFIGNASVILPVPAFILVFTFGSILNPLLVGLAAGVGGGLGEITGHLIGRGGRKALLKKYKKQLARTKTWTKKRGIFPVIIMFGATPLPSDVIGIFSGLIRYDYKKFFLASIIGKTIMNTYIALAGYYSFEAIKFFFGI